MFVTMSPKVRVEGPEVSSMPQEMPIPASPASQVTVSLPALKLATFKVPLPKKLRLTGKTPYETEKTEKGKSYETEDAGDDAVFEDGDVLQLGNAEAAEALQIAAELPPIA